ncbi:MAG: ABC transporter permease [Candidatus Parabeggiatoa sp. nov. 3]|nr:MAG: ABC transporter permease [Gammaproteobacteria bacterium]RKZ67411.1 MAG: ABC transporter permease [Gammaproteobacteria bacterium]RKZ89143.1 MAG: ABC transporter permease [Gammaproteobacteria bacterium]HEW98477.1 ABC transporter permease [Beggiatoa sp.]
MILRLAWRNIWRHPRRSGLTIAAIAFAAFLLVFMITLQLGSYDMMIENNLSVLTGHFQVQRQGYLDKPKMRSTIAEAQSLAETLRKINGILDIAVRANGFALVASEQRTYGTQIIGVETAHETQLSTIPKRIQSGQFLSSDNAQEVIIGEALARNLKVKVGDELTFLGSGYDGSIAAAVLPIVGIFNSGLSEIDRGLIEMPLTTFQEIFSMGESAHILVGMVKNFNDLETVLANLTGFKNLSGLTTDLVVLDWNALVPGLRQMIEADKINGWFMYGCLILIVTFSILNTFLMAVLERTREFGVMLALGTKPLFIGKLVILESCLLTLVGLAIGLLFGTAITLYYYVYGFSYPGMAELGAEFGLSDTITPQLSILAFTLGPTAILVFTLIASLYPALRIRLLKPVDAMKSV